MKKFRSKKGNFDSMHHLLPTITILSALVLFSTANAFGQENFAELSAKDRIKIAEQEEIDARSDVSFQRTMQAGHDLFKNKHYLKAIHKYEAAQEMRPYNVYPKVIIADIELSMKDTLAVLRKAEQMEKQIEGSKEISEARKQETPEPESEAERLKRQEEWEQKEREKRATERARQKALEQESPVTKAEGDIHVISTAEFREELASQYPSGITEEISSEGNKTITKRVKVADGKGDEYKRVVHGWGGVFYFKNGEAVTERVWIQETEQ